MIAENQLLFGRFFIYKKHFKLFFQIGNYPSYLTYKIASSQRERG
jgi:hypothetical protein